MIFCALKNIKIISIYLLIGSMYLNLNIALYISIIVLTGVSILEFLISGKARVNRVAILHLLFTFYIFISFLWVEYPTGAWKASLVTMCLVFIFSQYDIWRSDEQRTFFNALIVAGIVLAVYVLKEFDLSNFQSRRVVLDRMNSNEIACNLSVSVFSIIFLSIQNKKKITWPGYLMILLFLSVIVLCRSKSGILLMVLLSGSCYVLGDLKKTGRRIIFFTGFMLICVYLLINVEFLYVTIGYRLEGLVASLFTGAESEDTIRIELYKFGLQLFDRAPFIGQGIDQFRFINLKELDFIGGAHNNYLEILVDFGIIGFILYYLRFLFIWINFKETLSYTEKVFIFTFFIGMLFLDLTRVTYNF